MSHRVGYKFDIKTIKAIVIINFIGFIAIFIMEILTNFIPIPIFVYSEGDAAGISEVTGNWFDHLLKSLMALCLILVFINPIRRIGSKDEETRKKALSFAIGGGFMVIGIGSMFFLSACATLFDMALTGGLSEALWYNYIRLETILALINIPILLIWRNKAIIIPNLIKDLNNQSVN